MTATPIPLRSEVAADGTFNIRDVSVGDYTLRVCTLWGDLIYDQLITVDRLSPSVEVRLPESKLQRPGNGTVSMQELAHPPSKQVRKLLESGTRLLDHSHYSDAAVKFREATKGDPDCSAAHAGLGLALTKEGQYSEAAEEYRAAVKLNPRNSMLHNNLGGVLAMLKQYDAAETEVSTALKLDPNNVRAHMILAAILLQTPGHTHEAMPHLLAAEQQFPSAKSAVAKICADHWVEGCPHQ